MSVGRARILRNLRALGWSPASLVGTTDRNMQMLVADGVVCLPPLYRMKKWLDQEYGLTAKGRAEDDARSKRKK